LKTSGAVIAVCLIAAGLLFSGGVLGAPHADWKANDVDGQEVDTAKLRGNVVLLAVYGRAMRPHALKLMKARIRRFGKNARVHQVNLIDAREVPFWQRPLAPAFIRTQQKKRREEIRSFIKAEKLGNMPNLSQRIRGVVDFEGTLVDRYPHGDTTKTMALFVIDAEGNVLGSYTQTQFEKALDAVSAALDAIEKNDAKPKKSETTP
jgi:peroxiredoxin